MSRGDGPAPIPSPSLEFWDHKGEGGLWRKRAREGTALRRFKKLRGGTVMRGFAVWCFFFSLGEAGLMSAPRRFRAVSPYLPLARVRRSLGRARTDNGWL